MVPWAFGMIRSLYDNEPEAYRELLESQDDPDEWIHAFFVAHELGELYDEYPEFVTDRLRELSQSEVEIVREGCARSWSRILERDFDRGFKRIKDLRSSGNYEERYTAVIAPVRYVRENERLPDEQRERIHEFWNNYRDDPKQGLWNIVRTQILPEVGDGHGENS